ncbi:MAG: hypothetical protein V9E89_19120 [Ilumatobacteraceae bacterium]
MFIDLKAAPCRQAKPVKGTLGLREGRHASTIEYRVEPFGAPRARRPRHRPHPGQAKDAAPHQKHQPDARPCSECSHIAQIHSSSRLASLA